MTGYLTKAREGDYKGESPDGMVALMIPNAEIKEIFETTVIKWFDDSTKKWNRNALFDAVWNGCLLYTSSGRPSRNPTVCGASNGRFGS